MDIEYIIEIFGSSIFVGMFFLYAGYKFLGTKYEKTAKNIIASLALIIFITFNYLFLNNELKMMVLYIAVLFVYRIIYNKSLPQSATASLMAYLMLVVGELLFAIEVAITSKVFSLFAIDIFYGDFIVNVMISLLATLFTLLIYKYIRKVIAKIKDNNKIIMVFTFAVILIAICSLFYRLSFNDWSFDRIFVFNSVLIVCMAYISIIIIKQQIEKAKISDDYEKAVEYSIKSEKLIERYSISQHENKNELIIIKSMVHKNNKRLLDYLNEIIKEKDNIEDAWIRFLRYLPFGGVKGIIHNKISEMKSQGIEVFLDISKAIEKSFLKELNVKENNQITKIIGVFLDNAKEAAVEAEEKKVTILIYGQRGHSI